MRITPRTHEIQRVVDILEDPTFDSPDQLAKAVIKEVADIIQMRDLVVLVHTWADGSKGMNMGPFGNLAEAEAFAKKMSFGGTGRPVPIVSSGVLLANHDGKTSWPGYCWNPACGHAPWTHALDGASRGECREPKCECSRFVKDDPNKKKPTKKAASKGAAKGVNEL
ncbi:hypothetical protein SEA_HANK144_62 [Streptomyces phage Hank144]|uniref:Uncharacterized protein n=1 Tax=Streptomyces phage Hank144 TaxID=2301573 RepID=A0A385DRI2_9CAUD|nr:hypothetical protein KGG76_gp62 [Streptomyces phage Hank144]AXQ61115.1 hypothetical protein SEA_HANK144_62 [Streptomyces phage Hank144]